MRDDEYICHDATALAELVRSGETTAGELLDVANARLARWNPLINAVVIPLEARAREQIRRGVPQGPFAGVPFLSKDLDVFQRIGADDEHELTVTMPRRLLRAPLASAPP